MVWVGFVIHSLFIPYFFALGSAGCVWWYGECGSYFGTSRACSTFCGAPRPHSRYWQYWQPTCSGGVRGSVVLCLENATRCAMFSGTCEWKTRNRRRNIVGLFFLSNSSSAHKRNCCMFLLFSTSLCLLPNQLVDQRLNLNEKLGTEEDPHTEYRRSLVSNSSLTRKRNRCMLLLYSTSLCLLPHQRTGAPLYTFVSVHWSISLSSYLSNTLKDAGGFPPVHISEVNSPATLTAGFNSLSWRSVWVMILYYSGSRSLARLLNRPRTMYFYFHIDWGKVIEGEKPAVANYSAGHNSSYPPQFSLFFSCVSSAASTYTRLFTCRKICIYLQMHRLVYA